MNIENVQNKLVHHKLSIPPDTPPEVAKRFGRACDFLFQELTLEAQNCPHIKPKDSMDRICAVVINVHTAWKPENREMWKTNMRLILDLIDDLKLEVA